MDVGRNVLDNMYKYVAFYVTGSPNYRTEDDFVEFDKIQLLQYNDY